MQKINLKDVAYVTDEGQAIEFYDDKRQLIGKLEYGCLSNLMANDTYAYPVFERQSGNVIDADFEEV